jgi:GNAT superfamily N-acetyltransferase
MREAMHISELQLRQQAQLDQSNSFVTTKAGRVVNTRLLGQDDAPLLVDFFGRLSERTRRLRFSKPGGDETLAWREATRLAQRDSQADTTLLGTVYEDGQERAVALVQVARIDATMAEIAAVVRDDYQNEGLGRALCRMATQLAMARGVRTLQFMTQAENKMVQRLIRSMGVPYTAEIRYGEVTMVVQLTGAA